MYQPIIIDVLRTSAILEVKCSFQRDGLHVALVATLFPNHTLKAAAFEFADFHPAQRLYLVRFHLSMSRPHYSRRLVTNLMDAGDLINQLFSNLGIRKL